MFAIQRRLRLLSIAAMAAAIAGCQAPWSTGDDPPADKSLRQTARTPDSRFKPPNPTAADGKLAAPINDALLAGVMDKIQQVSQIDPAATPQLLAELQRTPPEFWSATAEQFRASLAYRQQLAAKNGDSQAASSRLATSESEPLAPSSPSKQQLAHPTGNPTDAKTQHIAQANFAAAAVDDGIAPIPIIGPAIPSTQPQSWLQLLDAAVGDLGTRVVDSPASTAEIHQHVTLRLLRLLAGQTEQALDPIPGIPPSEQDYWSQQIFALATYLDHHSQPDDKRRAAATAVHVDEALVGLRDVGALTLRNLTICKQVNGFGAYDPVDAARISAGQSLTLYVEVENFHSRSSDKGFTTLLASSYEIFDADGLRVAGDAFPDVTDNCRSRRRDFHIQYTFALPTRLAPGRYRLQLVVDDRQTDEMANSAVEFEVGGVKGRESRESAKGQASRFEGQKLVK